MSLSAGTRLGPYEILTPVPAKNSIWRRRGSDRLWGCAFGSVDERAAGGRVEVAAER